MRVYAQTDHPSDVTVHFVYQGSTNVSYFQTGYFVCTEKKTPQVIYPPQDSLITTAFLFGTLGGIVSAALLAQNHKKQ